MESRKSKEAIIDSRPLWNNTGIEVEAGRKYQLRAHGQWTDKEYVCGPAGYQSPDLLLRLLEWARRAPKCNWFALIGSLDSNEKELFLIGDEVIYTPSRAGTLTCFANDTRLTYSNNHGKVILIVTQLD